MSSIAADEAPAGYGELASRHRWLALLVLCLGVLMIVLDTTIVNVALPSIREDLGLSESSLVWVVNGYMLTFGGFLLLGGRLGDLYGPRRVFLIGITFFTIASLACGLAASATTLFFARAAQGLGGAVVLAVALSLIVRLFVDPAERARAIGTYSFVCTGGSSMGVLIGGAITSSLNWHWIFLVNLPIGVAVYVLARALLPRAPAKRAEGPLDVSGAILATSAIMLAIYAVVGAHARGWASPQTLGLLTGAAILIVTLLRVESRVPMPLIPLRIFRLRNFAVATAICALWTAGACAWSFLTALYLQLVLGYDPMQVALAFLPANLLTAALSLGLSARIVTHFGIRRPLWVGLLLGALGLALFARAPVDGSLIKDVLPSMILLGLGGGIAFSPLMLAAMRDVPTSSTGLASGVIGTVSNLAGALGLAILASVCAARTNELLSAGVTREIALAAGYRVGFFCGAVCAGAAVIISALLRMTVQVPAVRTESESRPAPAE